ncbi:hypothetical protein NDU88_002463 [Pleurodeles waltl]|uniref:Uncharacterized protein n=1 Tax=Pleurodeles waltl TaxID=8319 RepID=A0AAV7UVP1_PLEWA|nr:hypothetical protein NDU88_002463 [Pleurodeles waltl]
MRLAEQRNIALHPGLAGATVLVGGMAAACRRTATPMPGSGSPRTLSEGILAASGQDRVLPLASGEFRCAAAARYMVVAGLQGLRLGWLDLGLAARSLGVEDEPEYTGATETNSDWCQKTYRKRSWIERQDRALRTSSQWEGLSSDLLKATSTTVGRSRPDRSWAATSSQETKRDLIQLLRNLNNPPLPLWSAAGSTGEDRHSDA